MATLSTSGLLADTPHVADARSLNRLEEAVPTDRVSIRPGEDVALMLPPGACHVRAVLAKA